MLVFCSLACLSCASLLCRSAASDTSFSWCLSLSRASFLVSFLTSSPAEGAALRLRGVRGPRERAPFLAFVGVIICRARRVGLVASAPRGAAGRRTRSTQHHPGCIAKPGAFPPRRGRSLAVRTKCRPVLRRGQLNWKPTRWGGGGGGGGGVCVCECVGGWWWWWWGSTHVFRVEAPVRGDAAPSGLHAGGGGVLGCRLRRCTTASEVARDSAHTCRRCMADGDSGPAVRWERQLWRARGESVTRTRGAVPGREAADCYETLPTIPPNRRRNQHSLPACRCAQGKPGREEIARFRAYQGCVGHGHRVDLPCSPVGCALSLHQAA